ncbi:hypothetical protein B296_00012744 [Ensete ventricosum]|uniref:Uncharacterized protein n=1 Tax=Ensete ventricosum TaxID=4639 RepID=A0A427ALI1_ENSVE|nr:hypothetical protein B296_00012744 [Ensete ventricosum]
MEAYDARMTPISAVCCVCSEGKLCITLEGRKVFVELGHIITVVIAITLTVGERERGPPLSPSDPFFVVSAEPPHPPVRIRRNVRHTRGPALFHTALDACRWFASAHGRRTLTDRRTRGMGRSVVAFPGRCPRSRDPPRPVASDGSPIPPRPQIAPRSRAASP